MHRTENRVCTRNSAIHDRRTDLVAMFVLLHGDLKLASAVERIGGGR